MILSKKLLENLDDLIMRVAKKKAAVVIIDGGLGEGKTTLGVECADYVNEYFGMGKVQLDSKAHPQYSMGADEFKLKLPSAFREGFKTLVYDEAGDFNNRNFASQFNKDMYSIFNVHRALGMIIFVVLPSYYDLDTGLWRLNIIRMGLHCQGREEKLGHFLGYSLKNLIFMRFGVGKKKIHPAFSYKYGSPNFAGVFKDLDKKRSRQLDELGTAKKLASIEVGGKQRRDLTEIQQGIVDYAKAGLTFSKIALKLGNNESYIRKQVDLIKRKGFAFRPVKRGVNVIRYDVLQEGV